MKQLERLRRNWDGLASQDALWSVLSDPARRGRAWSREDFLRAGTVEVATVFDRLREISALPSSNDEALDFGCGAGRLTSGLAARFSGVHGVDISGEMLRQAREMTEDVPRCYFHINLSQDLRLFESGRFGFVYSNIVLQHMPPALALGYIREFMRVLRPGGVAVFQVPDKAPKVSRPFAEEIRHTLLGPVLNRLRQTVALRTRLARLLKRQRYAMEMHTLSEQEIAPVVQAAGGTVVDIALTNASLSDYSGNLEYLKQAPKSEWLISKQYTVIRRQPSQRFPPSRARIERSCSPG